MALYLLQIFRLRKAVHSDLEELQEVINKAYDVETGNTGVSFKRARRYRTLAEVEEQMKYLHVLLENEVIVGGVRTVVSEDFKKVSIGPVAVHPDHQVRSQNSRNTVLRQLRAALNQNKQYL